VIVYELPARNGCSSLSFVKVSGFAMSVVKRIIHSHECLNRCVSECQPCLRKWLHACSFAESKRWVLAATGPLLAVVSPRFRRQWVAALRGERVPAKARNSTDLALIYVSKNADVLPAGKTSM